MRVFSIFLFVFILEKILLAQDPHFSQFYQAPIYLNPGYVGVTKQQRVVFNHRTQWPNLPQAFATYSASYDIWIGELRSGFGILATTDKMGTAGWQTTTVGLLYSYKIKLTDNIVLSPGLYLGYGINGIDRTKITLGDGLRFNGQTLDPTIRTIGNQQYFDFTAGLVAYSKKIWLGASFNHINTPNISVLNVTSRLPMKINIHGGLRLLLSDRMINRYRRVSYLTPSFVFRIQGPITQMDLGINYHVDPVSIGLWYRGKPYELSEGGVLNQDAMIVQLGAYLYSFTLGYSYDFSISRLSASSGGSHEISIIYEFAVEGFLRKERKSSLIPCPSFNSSGSFLGN